MSQQKENPNSLQRAFAERQKSLRDGELYEPGIKAFRAEAEGSFTADKDLEMIKFIGQSNPIVYTYLMLHQTTDLSWEAILQKLVIYLAEQNTRLSSELIRSKMREAR